MIEELEPLTSGLQPAPGKRLCSSRLTLCHLTWITNLENVNHSRNQEVLLLLTKVAFLKTMLTNILICKLYDTQPDEKRDQIFAVSLRMQFQMNKTVRKPLVFPLVCCKSNYEEYISFSQILLGSLLKYMSHLQHGPSKNFTWENSKLLNKGYIKGFITGHWVIVLTVAATTNQTWNQGLLWSMTCGHTSHWKFKTQYHEIPLGHPPHTTFNP